MSGPELLTIRGAARSPVADRCGRERSQVAEQTRQEILDRFVARSLVLNPTGSSSGRRPTCRASSRSHAKQLPADWRPRVDTFLQRVVQTEYDGERFGTAGRGALGERKALGGPVYRSGSATTRRCRPALLSRSVRLALRTPWQVLGPRHPGGSPGKLFALAPESGLRIAAVPPFGQRLSATMPNWIACCR